MGAVGGSSIAVGVDDATGVVTIIPCAGFVDVAGGTATSIAIGSSAGGTNRITNPALAGTYVVDLTDVDGDCSVGTPCRIAVPILSSGVTTVSGSVAAPVGGPPPAPGDTTPPVISSIVVGSITKNSVVISWATDGVV